jgi:Holliday junction resolvase RusA-like endonuclease
MRFRVPRPKSAPKRVLWPATRPDLDKLCRHAADALSGLIYTDDARVVELIASKTFAIGEPPGVRITVEDIS